MTAYLTLNQVLHIDDAEVIFFGLAGGEISQEALAIWIKKTLSARNST